MPSSTPQDVEIREFTMEDYPQALALWQATEGITVDSSDSRENLARFLDRNPGLSFVACRQGRLVAAVLGGYDGRRGLLHHVAVASRERRRGIGTALVARCVRELRTRGVLRCHLFVNNSNPAAVAFWKNLGWRQRDDLTMMSLDILPSA
jgi:ribosomal protein S18 acetylase RimI-like enzyme